MTSEDAMESKARPLIFGVRDLFFVVTISAIFLTARQWAISLEDERWVAIGISFVGVATPVYAAFRKARYFLIYLSTTIATFVVSTEWACECVYKSAGTSFLRQQTLPGSYSADAELNTLMVIAATIGMTVVGGTLGATCRFLGCRLRSASSNKLTAEVVDRQL